MNTMPQPNPQLPLQSTQPQLSLQQTADPTHPQQSVSQTAAGTSPSAMPTPQQKIQKAADKSTKSLLTAATSLPRLVSSSIKQHDTYAKIRDKQVIDMVVNAHVGQVTAMQKVQQLKQIGSQIQQHMKELEAEPASPQKTIQISYLAHSMKSVVTALKQASGTIKQSQQTIQAIAAEPKNRKLLAKATGIDPKSQDSPEHQAMVGALNAQMQKINAAKTQAQQQAQTQAPQPTQIPYANGPEPSIAPESMPNVQGPHGFGHRLKQIAEVLGTIAMPQQMALIPGTPQNKALLRQKALALQEQLLKMQGEQAGVEEKKAQTQHELAAAGAEVPADVKEKQFEEEQAERRREAKAREDQAKATADATAAYRKEQQDLAQQRIDQEAKNQTATQDYRKQELGIQRQRNAIAEKKIGAGGNVPGDTTKSGKDYLKTLPPKQADLIRQIGTGKIAIDRMGYLVTRNPQLLSAVSQAYPDFDSTKAANYIHAYKDFTSGKTADQITGGDIAVQHLAQLKAINDKNPVQVHIPGTAANVRYNNLMNTVVNELSTFYAEPKTNEARKAIVDTLGSPVNRDAAITQQAAAMAVRMNEFQNRWQNAAPSSAYQAPMPKLSNQGRQAFETLVPGQLDTGTNESKVDAFLKNF